MPEPPSVIHITPADNAENVDLATDIRVEFSEPVHNLVPGQTVYVQEDGKPEKIGGTILSGGTIVQPDTPAISSIVFKPTSSLTANKKYFVYVTNDVRDDTNDGLDQQYNGQGDTTREPFSSSFQTFGGMVITPQPITESATRIAVAGTYALAMQSDQSGRSRVNIYDISSPSTPTVSGSFYVPQRAFDIAVTDSEEDSLKVDGRVHTRLAAVVTYSPLHLEQWANIWFVNWDEVTAPEIVGVTSIFLPLDVPSTPLSVQFHQGRAYIGNVPYQGVNVVDVAQSIHLFNEGLARGKNPVVDAVRPETGQQFAGFGQSARVQTATLRESVALDATGTAPSIATLDLGRPVVFIANSFPRRLGVLQFPLSGDGFNIALGDTSQVHDPRIVGAFPVVPNDSEPRLVKAIEDVSVQGGQRVPLVLLMGAGRLWIFHVEDPSHPAQYPSKSWADLGLTGTARWFDVEGTLAYVAIDNDVAVIDFADPANPRLVEKLTGVGSHLSALAVKDGFIYSLSPGSDGQDGLSVAIASPASRLFIYGASADPSTVCGNPIIVDRNTHKMRQAAGFYFEVFGHRPPGTEQITIRKGEQIITTVTATILPTSTDLITIGRAEWNTGEDIDRAATYTAELTLDENAANEFHSRREVIPFSYLLENYNESMTLPIEGSTAQSNEKFPYAFVLGTNANVTLTVAGNVVLNGPRSFGLHVEPLGFTGMAEGRYPFTLRAEAQGDPSIADQISGVLTIQRNIANARPPGHTVVGGVDIASGNLGLSQGDVPEIANRGLALSFTRSYNTALANSFGPLGYGWQHNFQVLLTSVRSGSAVTYSLRGGDGSGQSFKATTPTGAVLMAAEKPYHGSLQRNSDGSFDYYTKARIRYHFPGAYEVNSFNFYDQSYMGNLEFMEEPDGNRLTLVYDSLGRMISVTDSSNRALQFEYQEGASPFAGVISTANATRTEQSCVPRGQLGLLRQRFVKAQGGVAWRIMSIKGPGGLVVEYGYDASGNLNRVTRKGSDSISAGTADEVWQYDYKPTPVPLPAADLTHFLKSVTNPNGHATNYDYWFDQLGLPVKTMAQPENASLNFSYVLDQNNLIKQTTTIDGRGNPTVYTLSVDGYTTALTAPRGAHSTFEYNDSGLKTRETDPLGMITTYEYDAKGNLRKRTSAGVDGVSVSSEVLYDQTYSRPLSQRDQNGNVTGFTLDGHGKTTQVRQPNGSVKQFDYAPNGDLLRVTDERGLHTQISYDAYGNASHVERETQAGRSIVTDNTYDVRSRLVSMTDTLQPSITRAYDALDRLKTEVSTDPGDFRDQLTSAYEYTPLGQTLSTTMSGNGQTRTQNYEYDNLERVSKLHEGGNGVAGPLTRTFTYDGNSNVLSVTDRRGVVTSYEYDALNYQTSVRLSGPFGPDIAVKTVTPDLVGNPLTIVDQYADTTTFDYDGLHRLVKRTLPGNYTEEQGLDPNGNVISTKDRNGRITTILYDALNRPVMRRDPGGRVQTWTFTDSTGTVVTNWSPQNITITEQADTIGRALRRVTAFGSNQYTTTISYTGRSRTTVDARGTSSTEQLSAFGEVGAFEIQTGTQTLRARMHYAALGGLKTTTDASDRTSTFTLDGLNRRTSASHQGGFSESWTYDGEGLRLSYTNKRGVTFSTTYDNQERQLTTSAQGFSETIPIASISYDDSHHKEIRTDGENHASSYTFDALHRVVSLTNADTQTRSFQYDGINLIRESNFRNQSTEYTYDSLNRVTQIKDPLNQVTIIGHSDLGGYTQTVTDRRGNTCVKAYDQLDRLTGVIEGGEALVTYEYDANNNRVAMIDGLSNRTAYTYDELNRVKTINHANLQTETYTYDNAGNVIAYNDGHGPSVTLEYDALDHLHKRTDGAGNTTEFRADGEGLLLEKIEPKSALHKTTYEYNALGSLKRVIDAGGGPWQLSYDRKQNLKSVTDARQNTTNYDYDALDRLTTVQQPHSLTTTYGYDADGNRTLIRDPKGQEFSLTYDALNRLKVRNFASADGSREDKYEYGYDPETNLTSVQNTRRQNAQVVTRSYALTYDARDRLTTATDAFGKTVSYQYDAANNLRNFTDAAGRPTAYTYDAHNRLQTATLTGSREAHYDWFADGLLQRVSYGAGLQREYAYDDADRVNRITNTVGVDGPQSQTEVFEYGYDGNSNRETETRKLNGQITRTAHYTYDQLDRLTQAAYDRPGATPAANTLTYGYDAAGNRVSENGTTAAGTAVARTFVNDELNRLTRVVDNGTIHDYEYDNNGNLTALKQDDGQLINSYEYDAWDQLRVVRSGPQRQEVARYDYDYARRRTSKALGGSSSEQRFVYNASAVVDEYDEQNHLLNRYDYGTEVIRGEFAGEGERFYFSDSLGSTTSLSQITQSGQASFSSVTASYEYDAWGNTERFDGNSFNQLGYTGQRFDAETNMWALGNGERYYSAGLGRFIQQDSLSGSNSQPQSLNRYAYTTNNPLCYTDPTGHTIEEGTQNQTQKGYVPPKMDMGWRDWLQVAWTLNQGIQESLMQPFKLAMDSANLPSTLAKAVITWKRPDPEDFYSNVFKGAAKEFKEHKPITEIIGNTAKGMLFNAITLGIGPWIVDEVHLAQDYTQGKISREQYDDASIRRTGNLIGDDLLIVLTEVALRAAPVRGAPRIAEESSFSAGMETPRLFEDPAGISRPSEGLQKVGASEAAAVREAPAGGLGGTVDISETGVEFGKGVKRQGEPFERFVGREAGNVSQLEPGFKTFDYFGQESGRAISVKTMDTTTAAKLAKPKQIYYSLKRSIDAAADFTKYNLGRSSLDRSQIVTREIQLGIPEQTTLAQWEQINRAIDYGASESRGVKLVVTKLK